MVATISFEDLCLGTANIYFQSDEHEREQTVYLSMDVSLDPPTLDKILQSDTISSESLSYAELARFVLEKAQNNLTSKMSIQSYMETLESFLLDAFPSLRFQNYTLALTLSKSLPFCKSVQVIWKNTTEKSIELMGFLMDCRIGINDWELNGVQPLELDFRMNFCQTELMCVPLDYFYKILKDFICKNEFKTLEKFGAMLSKRITTAFSCQSLEVIVRKPLGLKHGKCASFRIASVYPIESRFSQVTEPYQYYLSLGSNLDNRKGQIQAAVRHIETHPHIRLLGTSFLYETAPMYVRDQSAFLNCMILVQTPLEPQNLLRETQRIEELIGRNKTLVNGPRRIDIDIVYCRNKDIRIYTSDQEPALQLPHPRFRERAFVLAPILDIEPLAKCPLTGVTLDYYLSKCTGDIQRVFVIREKVFPLNSTNQLGSTSLSNDTLHSRGLLSAPFIMGILNVTPDSFSDGNAYQSPEAAVAKALEMSRDGAVLIDIGGQSTKPGSQSVSVAKERSRIQPVLNLLVANHPDILLSVDTFSSLVLSGLARLPDVVNDISGGTLDPELFTFVSEKQLPYILGHLRGTPQTMMDLAGSYGTDDPLTFVRRVLADVERQLTLALKAGVYRWNIIVDPGIGFAKIATQSLFLLKYLDSFLPLSQTFPVLLGASRKSFIQIINNELLDPLTNQLDIGMDNASMNLNDSMVDRVYGSIVAGLWPRCPWMVRVHDVRPHVLAFKMQSRINM